MKSPVSYSNSSELVGKILFTILILVICRIGSYIPVAGIDINALNEIAARNQTGILGMFNMLSGGSLGRMSIFALAIMPYITASIMMQLISIIYKPLEDLRKEGEVGRGKISQMSRYLTVLLATFQAYGIAVGLGQMTTDMGPVVVIPGALFKLTTVVTLVVGTMFLMWLGEQISSKGIGNGSSLIIFIGIIASIPSAIITTFELARKGAIPLMLVLVVCLLVIGMIAFIIFIEQSQRKVVIYYPKRQVGNKIYGGDTTYLPLKLNTSGVIPPIFASALLLFPLTIANFIHSDSAILEAIRYHLSHGKPLFILLYAGLIAFFSFFYTAVVFNSEETAENLKKYGAYITGRRPGKHTAEYLDYLLGRLTVLGSSYLCLICIAPEILMNKVSIAFSLGGTSMLIVVNVILDTFNQIQTFLFSSKYESLVKKIRVKQR